MKEWSDEELDGLFRKSFEEFDPPVESNDWNDLRDRLDATDNPPVVGNWTEKYWPLAVLLLIVIGGIGVYYGVEDGKVGEKRDTVLSTPVRRPSDQSAQKNSELSPVNQNAGITRKLPAADPNKESTTDFDLKSGSLFDQKQVTQNEEIRKLPRNLASVSGVRKQPNLTDSEGGDGVVSFSKNEINTQTVSTEIVENKMADGPVRSASDLPMGRLPKSIQITGTSADEVANFMPSSTESSERSRLLSIESLTPHNFVVPTNNFKLPVIASSVVVQTTTEPELPAKVNTASWAIRIGVAPNLSAVTMSMKNFDRPDLSASLLVERSLSKKWFLQTGVVRSLKTYSALAGEYEWPSGPGWYQSEMPTSIDGACRVFEVPINLRFDFIQREQNRWFVGAGVSSYKMQNEKYTYHYKSFDPTIRWWNWEGKTGWYLFSHLSASVGYERKLSQRLSVVMEPHLRVPIRKVGLGKVNLFTTGIWVAFRYTPVFQK
jgi:hypothetical protein